MHCGGQPAAGRGWLEQREVCDGNSVGKAPPEQGSKTLLTFRGEKEPLKWEYREDHPTGQSPFNLCLWSIITVVLEAAVDSHTPLIRLMLNLTAKANFWLSEGL